MFPVTLAISWYPSPARTYYLGAGALQGPLRAYRLGTWEARGSGKYFWFYSCTISGSSCYDIFTILPQFLGYVVCMFMQGLHHQHYGFGQRHLTGRLRSSCTSPKIRRVTTVLIIVPASSQSTLRNQGCCFNKVLT